MTIRMYRLLYIAALLLAGIAQAQQMPERSLVRKGNRQYHKGNYERAIERYQAAETAAPASFEAAYDLGNALYKAERFEAATEAMRRAAADSLRSDDERAEAFYNLGNAQFKQQQYKEALESYRQSLRLNPADMEAKYNYAYTKRMLDDQQDQQDQQQNQQNQDQQQQNQQDQQQQNQQDQQQDQQDQQQDQQQQDRQDQQQQDPQQGEGRPQPNRLSEQEQQQMLDAIQAQEDKTQEKLKEKQGILRKVKKNW